MNNVMQRNKEEQDRLEKNHRMHLVINRFITEMQVLNPALDWENTYKEMCKRFDL